MTKFYTIISFGPEPNADTDLNPTYSRSRSVRSYKSIGSARAAKTRGSFNHDLMYKLLLTTIHNDGVTSTEWVTDW